MSRESELYRDKIEVSLDGRQIFYLFFGGAVIVGLVFVLGVMVGRRVEARGHIEHAQTAATADPLAALDRLETRGGLSFQGSLRGNEAPASDVDKTIGAIAKARQPATPAVAAPAAPAVAVVESPKKAEDKKADHKSETEKATKTDKPEKKLEVEKKDGEKRTGEKKLDAEKKADKKIEAGEKREIEKKESEKKDSEKKDIEKKEGEKKAEVKPRFTLQLSSFQDKTEAQAFLDSIKSSGFQAYLTEGEVDGKQYFRVRLGNYRSMDAANDAKSEFEKAAKKSALVTRL